MFGRGTWAIVGLAKESLETCRTNLEDRAIMAACSQLAASAVNRQFSSDTLGINPFRAPRLDEEHPIGPAHQEALAQYAITEHGRVPITTLPQRSWTARAMGSPWRSSSFTTQCPGMDYGQCRMNGRMSAI